ncbi:MAG: homocysteine S-methyltransferase family protein [Candidatus Peribacteraceae bacterium]
MTSRLTQPHLLSGPFGSYINDRHHMSVEELFRREEIDPIRAALREYRASGVNQSVTPTFGASARGTAPGPFTSDKKRWNTEAAFLTQLEFPNKLPFGSVAPLLDTCGHDDRAWAMVQHQVEVARRAHTPQIQALYDGGIRSVLAEAVHDYYEAIGFVKAASDTGMHRAIVSFQPTKKGMPRNSETCLSYNDILDRLRLQHSGNTHVDIGLNCDNYDGIHDALDGNPAGTFALVYPNQCAVPAGSDGERFWELANKNHERTQIEEKEFQKLRLSYAIPQTRILQLLTLAQKNLVECVGFCCGATPEHTRQLHQMLQAMPSDAQPVTPSV